MQSVSEQGKSMHVLKNVLKFLNVDILWHFKWMCSSIGFFRRAKLLLLLPFHLRNILKMFGHFWISPWTLTTQLQTYTLFLLIINQPLPVKYGKPYLRKITRNSPHFRTIYLKSLTTWTNTSRFLHRSFCHRSCSSVKGVLEQFSFEQFSTCTKFLGYEKLVRHPQFHEWQKKPIKNGIQPLSIS